MVGSTSEMSDAFIDPEYPFRILKYRTRWTRIDSDEQRVSDGSNASSERRFLLFVDGGVLLQFTKSAIFAESSHTNLKNCMVIFCRGDELR